MRPSRVFALGALAIFVSVPLHAEIFLQEGQSYVWEFTTMSRYLGSSPAPWTVQFGTDPAVGEMAEISYFENLVSNTPIRQQTVTGQINGFIFFGPEKDGHFQDFQGVVRVRALSGDFGIQSITVGTQIDGQNYLASVLPVPEPGAGMLVGMAAMLQLAKRRRCSKPQLGG